MSRQVEDVGSLPFLLCFLFPSSSHWCEVGHGSDFGGEGREGASFPHLAPPCRAAGWSSGRGSP